MRWIYTVLFLACLFLGLMLRAPDPAERPMHHDEANQAYRFGILLEKGIYQYDAEDHHGPTLYYLTLPVAWLSGQRSFADTDEMTVRMVPLIFGMLLICAVPLLRSGMGGAAVLFAALFTAVSPGLVYFSRFYIQEMLLIFFTLLSIGAGWQSWRLESRGWAILCGLAIGLMFATKETAVLAYAAMGGSALLCALPERKLRLPLKNILIGSVCAVLVAALLFSGFLQHPSGPLDSILAFKGYFERGSGVDTDHVHEWSFYLKMLLFHRVAAGPVWSEALFFVLGVIGCIAVALKRIPAVCDPGLARFILFYTLLLTSLYSLIAYKTPWCALSFLHGWILLAAYGAAALMRPAKWRWLFLGLIVLFSLQLSAVAGRSIGRYAADPRNPYVYAHTSTDFKKMVERVEQLAAVHAAGREMYVQVILPPKQTWPLPFYLRRYANVGYWNAAELVPAQPRADLMVADPDHESDPDEYIVEYYGLRPGVLLSLHIRTELWNRFVETRRGGFGGAAVRD